MSQMKRGGNKKENNKIFVRYKISLKALDCLLSNETQDSCSTHRHVWLRNEVIDNKTEKSCKLFERENRMWTRARRLENFIKHRTTDIFGYNTIIEFIPNSIHFIVK